MRLAPISLALAALPAAADVLVVDDDPGPGVRFHDIEQAVDASSPEDVVLVRTGTYPGFLISQRSVTVLADEGADVRIAGRIEVRSIQGSGDRVMLRGLRTVSTPDWGLLVRNCSKTVYVEDCSLFGAGGIQTASPDGFPAVEVRNSAVATFVRCSLIGGRGADLENEDFELVTGNGGAGLHVTDSSVVVLASSLQGGDGGHNLDTTPVEGGNGGSGLLLGGVVESAGTTFTGGRGGVGDGDIFFCAIGGDGGHGVLQADSLANVFLTDPTFEPGAGGAGGAGCGPGSAGLDVLQGPGSAPTIFPGAARALAASSPVREEGLLELSFFGEPGDVVFALFSADYQLGSSTIDDFGTPLLLQLPVVPFFLGTVPPSAELEFTSTLGSFGNPARENATLFVQGAAGDANGALFLSSSSVVTWIDAAF